MSPRAIELEQVIADLAEFYDVSRAEAVEMLEAALEDPVSDL